MTKSIALRFALVAGTAFTIVAALGTASEARDIKVQRKMQPVVGTTVEAEELRAAAAAPTVAAVAAVSPCARKVKVVYAGYGEAERASANCAAAAVTAAN